MLKLESISKTYALGTSKELRVLEDINLIIQPGEFAVLLGNNGVGKSTLMRIIAGDIDADSGKVSLNGVELTKLPAYKRAQYLSYIRQSREQNLVACLTVSEIFMLAMSHSKPFFKILIKHNWDDRIKTLLESIKQGIENRINEQVWTLSGGEHQIITILIAAELIRNSPSPGNLLLLDEHVAHLDPKSSKTVMSLTSELVYEYGLTTLMVTHNTIIASQHGNRVLVLKEGKITFDKTYPIGETRNPTDFLSVISE